MGIVGVPFADDLRRRPSRLGLTAPLGQPGFPLAIIRKIVRIAIRLPLSAA